VAAVAGPQPLADLRVEGVEFELIYTPLTNQRPVFNSDDDAMFEVARKLEGKRCLLVIDDVWRLYRSCCSSRTGAWSSWWQSACR
jgi:hypothetical protein